MEHESHLHFPETLLQSFTVAAQHPAEEGHAAWQVSVVLVSGLRDILRSYGQNLQVWLLSTVSGKSFPFNLQARLLPSPASLG